MSISGGSWSPGSIGDVKSYNDGPQARGGDNMDTPVASKSITVDVRKPATVGWNQGYETPPKKGSGTEGC